MEEDKLVIKPAVLRDHSDKYDLVLFKYSVELVGDEVFVKAENVPEHTNGVGTKGAWVGLAIRQALDGTESIYPVFRGLDKLSDDAKDSEDTIDGEVYDTLYFEGERATETGPYTLGIVRNGEVYANLQVHFDVSVLREDVDSGMSTMGVLGYVTLEEADQYVAEHYMTTEEVRIGWEKLEDEDKAALLRRSFQAIELLPFAGHKTCCVQPTAFPRWPFTEIPDAVKFAQIEQSLVGADDDANEDAKHYEKLWQWGVSSYTIGNLSESISTGNYGAGALRTAGISSATASRLLAPFIQGGYSIR